MVESIIESCSCAGFLKAPGQFVIDSFRSCLAGYDLVESASWEFNCRSLLVRLGAPAAKLLVPELHLWALALRQNAGRSLTYYPRYCCHLCHDEFMALAALSAAQNADEDAGLMALKNLQAQGFDDAADFLWQLTSRCARCFAAAGILLQPFEVEVVDLAGQRYRSQASPPHMLN